MRQSPHHHLHRGAASQSGDCHIRCAGFISPDACPFLSILVVRRQCHSPAVVTAPTRKHHWKEEAAVHAASETAPDYIEHHSMHFDQSI